MEIGDYHEMLARKHWDNKQLQKSRVAAAQVGINQRKRWEMERLCHVPSSADIRKATALARAAAWTRLPRTTALRVQGGGVFKAPRGAYVVGNQIFSPSLNTVKKRAQSLLKPLMMCRERRQMLN